ncbi:MAG: Rid family hydrolase [Planctomycetota bacterium]
MRSWILRTLPLALVLAASCASSGEGARHLPAPGAIGPYSGSVGVGPLVFASGKIGSERDGSFAAEAESAIDAVVTELKRSGLELRDVVSVQVYLTDMGRYAEFNQIYARRLPAPYPARTCVAVAALPAGARVEITVTAARSR